MQGARPLPGRLVVTLVWRSLTGLGRHTKHFWPSGASSLVWVMHGVRPRARCFAACKGARADALAARARLPPCPRGLLTRHDPRTQTRRNRPGTVHVALSDMQSGLKRPCKDLHMSGTARLFRNGLAPRIPTSCKNRRKECPPAPKKGRERPEGAVFCALRNLALPTQVFVGALNAQYLTRRHEYGEAARNAGERGPRKVPEARQRRDPRPVAEGWQLFGEGRSTSSGSHALVCGLNLFVTVGNRVEKELAVVFRDDPAVEHDHDAAVVAAADQPPDALPELEHRFGEAVVGE